MRQRNRDPACLCGLYVHRSASLCSALPYCVFRVFFLLISGAGGTGANNALLPRHREVVSDRLMDILKRDNADKLGEILGRVPQAATLTFKSVSAVSVLGSFLPDGLGEFVKLQSLFLRTFRITSKKRVLGVTKQSADSHTHSFEPVAECPCFLWLRSCLLVSGVW